MAHRTVPTAMTSIDDDDDDGECQLVSVTNRLPYYVRHLCKSHSHRHKPTSMPIMKTHEPKGVSDVETLPKPSSEQRIECVHSSCSNVPKTSSVAVFSLSSSSSSSSLSSLSESILSSTIMATRFIPVGHFHDQDAATSEKNHSTNTSNFREQIPLNSYYSSSSSSSSSSSTSSTKKDILPSYKSSTQYLPTVDTLTIEQNLFNMVRFDTVKSNFCDYYQLGNFVRSGGFSDIHEGVRLSDNKPVVVKFIPKDKTKNWLMVSQKKYPAEVLLHKAVHEIQGVIHVYDYFENAQNWILVMERLRHCQDLFDYLESSDRGKLNETTAKKFFQQLVQINLAMFRKGVVHRDLKSENILVDLDTNSLILIDFGASAIFKSSGSFYSDFHGTKQYKSPEYILKKRYGGVPSTVWTLGVLLYDMVCGSLPFESEEEITGYKLVLKAHLSPELRNLIQRCLAPNPERRPSLEGILEHPWLKN